MDRYEIGKPLKMDDGQVYTLLPTSSEGGRFVYWDHLFCIHWVLDQPSEETIEKFRSAPLFYGISVHEDIPHIFLKIGEEEPLVADALVCARMGYDDIDLSSFFETDDADYHDIDVALFDKKTSNVLAVRQFKFSGPVLNEVRESGVRQQKKYQTPREAGEAITAYALKYPPRKVIEWVSFQRAES